MTGLFFILLATGLLLIGAEIFLPGGLAGVLGGLSLLGAAVVAFGAFGVQVGLLAALGILVLSAICLAVWIVFFPRTRMGRKLTLESDGKDFKATPEAEARQWEGRTGQTITDLRPAGIARIGGQRVDVVTESDWIPANTPIVILRAEGNRIIVRRENTPAGTNP